jgi:hypothetical protein
VRCLCAGVIALRLQLLSIVYGLIRNCNLLTLPYDKIPALQEAAAAHVRSPYFNNSIIAIKIMGHF